VLVAMILTTVSAGLFAGAAVYITAVEHPARRECGPRIGVAEFRTSYRRGALMQAPLAGVGMLTSAYAWYAGAGLAWLIWGVALGVLIPFTVVVILPTNKRLLDPALDAASVEASELLTRWGRLHAVRTIVGIAVFLAFVLMLSRP